jgi:phospholipase/carboxylesterase
MGQKSKLVQVTTWTLVAAMALTGLYVGFAAGPDPRAKAAAEAAAAKAAIEVARAQAAAEAARRAAEAPAAAQPAEAAPIPAPSAEAVRLDRVDVPADLGPADAPVVVGLHGRGDTAAAFSGLAARLGPAGEDGVALAWRGLAAPYAWGPGKAWFLGNRQRPERMDAALALVAGELRALREQGRKVALFGFSQGCMMIAHLVLTQPDAVDAAICVGGSAIGELPTPASGARLPPVLVVAGTADPVVPIAEQRAMITALEARGIVTERIEHPGAHTIPAETLAPMRKWLRDKLIGPAPAR